MILPMVKYLESHDVQFHYGVKVVNVVFDMHGPSSKLAKSHRNAFANGKAKSAST